MVASIALPNEDLNQLPIHTNHVRKQPNHADTSPGDDRNDPADNQGIWKKND